MITVQANKYITLATMTKPSAWEALVEAVEAAKQEANGEKICVSFMLAQVTETNPYLSKILLDDQIIIECIENNTTHKVLHTAAFILLHDKQKLKDKFCFQKIVVQKTLTKKELDLKKRLDSYKNAITTILDEKGPGKTSVFVAFADITRGCNLNNLRNVCKDLPDYFEVLKNVCLERSINDIMISMRGVDYHANLIDAFFKSAIRIFNENSLKITFTDCNDELNSKLRLHMKLTYNNGSTEDVLEYINKLGVGRVVLLTKLKDHNTENMLYREEDEVVAQFIAIIRQISADAIEFKYTGFEAMKTFHDLLAYYGSPDEFEDRLLMHTVSIKLTELGCTDIRIAKGWHLNLLNGDVAGSDEFNYISTYTSETIKALAQPEEVVLPEFIRRSLRSWHEQFNERAMLIDIQNFKKKCKRKHN